MNSRIPRTPTRSQSALIHRGPQAMSAAAPQYSAPIHAPNAALLIDFDNVTMGIRSDLGKELRSLLSSEIIKGKVAVQRAYADWRRYPQYIVPLSEASIDLIFAPAYGSSKKNATDIRLAIDALELVFTRPEIGTFILLSGDSDFSALVLKLKEYGKYVIGVGIRESSSDLLIQNCDEYYSYNELAGFTKESDVTYVRRDPWELVIEAVKQMTAPMLHPLPLPSPWARRTWTRRTTRRCRRRRRRRRCDRRSRPPEEACHRAAPGSAAAPAGDIARRPRRSRRSASWRWTQTSSLGSS